MDWILIWAWSPLFKEIEMLVLSRKEVSTENEIVIGEGKNQILIRVVAIDGCRVRLGIEAGKEIKILRGELREKNGK